jgi:putative transposase
MKNTYSELYLHFIFASKVTSLIQDGEMKNDLYKYMTGIIKNRGQKLLIINGMPDHVHILVNVQPDLLISDFVREVKEHSTKFINKKYQLKEKFYWQTGYGCVSFSKRDIPKMIAYVEDQAGYHQTISFKEEFIRILVENEIEYKPEYLFDFIGEPQSA